jgi:hypothetical protein
VARQTPYSGRVSIGNSLVHQVTIASIDYGQQIYWAAGIHPWTNHSGRPSL